MQYRAGAAMEYELSCVDVELCLRIGPRDPRVETSGFQLEARIGRAADAIRITECGDTRLDALRAVVSAWRDRALAGFPTLDWDAVTRALVAVKAV